MGSMAHPSPVGEFLTLSQVCAIHLLPLKTKVHTTPIPPPEALVRTLEWGTK